MTDKELQDLIRLKKYEQPEEGYFDNFLAEFQQRQRAEMLNTSARGLLLERAKAWFREFGAMRWVAGAGVAYAAIALVFNAFPTTGSGVSSVAATSVTVADSEADALVSSPAMTYAARDTSDEETVSMALTEPVDFSGPTPVFSAEERIF